MGCGHSKPPRRDQDAPVALCRDRSALLAQAIRHRYALADAHRAYAASLRAAGAALHDFLLLQPQPPPPEPAALPLRLPERRKGDPLPAADAPNNKADDDAGHICFHSDDEDGPDGAHISFPSDDEADTDVPRLEPLPPAAPAPPPQVAPPYYSRYAPPLYSHVPGHAYGYGADIDGYGHNFFNISYARSQPPPSSVSYEHRTQATNATVHYYPGNGASGPPLPGSYYGGYQYRYPNDSGFHETAASSVDGTVPSPPQVSSWDFFNPFQSVETYYQEEPAAVAAHTPRRTTQEGSECEILELENAKVEEEVVKEEVRNNGNHDSEADRAGLAKDKGRSGAGEEPRRESKSSEASSMVHDVHVVEKSVVEEHSDAAAAVPGKSYNDDIEVAREIRSQFEHAANSAANVSKVLEVGKMPYHHKSSGLKVSSSMIICVRPSVGEEFLQFVEDKATEHGNLSSTLQKLYMWEEKLLEELKTEEKMRVLYDKKCEELKVLYERGAEAHKLEDSETYIRKLSTKISVAIQVVNTISKKINKLRDEELWPQTNELIQGLMQMWHAMSECHKIQCHALAQAKSIDSTVAATRFSEAHIDLIKNLELELLDLVASFAAWVNAQTSYIGTINDWLRKGIDYVPELTDDGTPPFSPGRLGAPPIFIICNNWATGIARIPETGVVDTMQALASQILHLWEKHRLEWRQGMMANREMDRELRVMERDQVSMRKALEAQNKKLVLVSNQGGVSLSAQAVRDGDPPSEAGLQSCMNKFFQAMESFAAACANAYKDLHLRCEERTRPAQETDRVS
ncbi:protein ALTERED PHOSPHATE STARVATION RESPONSE 1-like [Triticum dicoccoides]|uniref:protein ALTERED PHOSPHATE STARVATION RESPONSE 1-like n=1 Tax=Triticum dicoccoides TaxID=85692 RepID=UPI001891AFA8|nr:protein ALTERED PHOSPHATE STARVATION RESPONSE 1-like [Triticum dicoccoides]